MPKNPIALEQLTWPEVEEFKRTSDVVLIPVGSTEQHGHHLPLGTDSINVDWMCQEAAKREPALVTPCIRFGVSHNHIDFVGTLTLEPETLIAVVMDMIRSLHHHDFTRVLIVNGHGGNNATLDVAAIKARKAFPNMIIGHAYSAALGKQGYKEVAESGIVYHADEGETSKSLVVSPELVDMEKATEGLEPVFTNYYQRYYKASDDPDSMYGLVSYGLPSTAALTQTGVMGDATVASKEKGEVIAEAAVTALVSVIQDIKQVNVLPKIR